MTNTVSYDFEIMNFVTVKAPYGVNPNTLLDQALEELLLSIRNNEIDLDCKNTYDQETGQYEPIPEDWYNGDMYENLF